MTIGSFAERTPPPSPAGDEGWLELSTALLRGEAGLERLCAEALERLGAAEVVVVFGGEIVASANARPGPMDADEVLLDVEVHPFECGARRGEGAVLIRDGRASPEFGDALAHLASAVIDAEATRARQAARISQLSERVKGLLRRARQLEWAAGKTAHDLKAPLVSMKGYVDMLLRGMGGELTATMQRYLGRVAAAVDRQKELIDAQVPPRSWKPVEAADLATLLSAAPGLERPLGPIWVTGPTGAIDGLVSELLRAGTELQLSFDEFRVTISVRRSPRLREGIVRGHLARLEGSCVASGEQLLVTLPARTPR